MAPLVVDLAYCALPQLSSVAVSPPSRDPLLSPSRPHGGGPGTLSVPAFYGICLLLVFAVALILTVEDLEVLSFTDASWGGWIRRASTWKNGGSISSEMLAGMPSKKTDKWIVVTSIQYPTEDVKRLASLPEWTLVVVGDKKTPADWSLPDVHYLTVEKQESLGFSSIARLPTASYTRKNAGYLYAIVNGAQWIYDTDDDNKPFGNGLDQFDYSEGIQGLRFHGNLDGNFTSMQEMLFNPYAHFGVHEMWPRGFPLEHIKDHSHKDGAYRLCNVMRAPAVQQGIVQKDPDVDAIYRLLHADAQTGLDERFNRFAPTVVLAPGTFSPWNSQNTLFKRDAFFGLVLPTTVAFRALLHLAGETVSFVPVNAVQQRNAHSYLKDFDQEIDVYDKAGEIVRFLSEWECGETTLDRCTVALAEEWAVREFWGRRDVDLVKAWVDDLRGLGYEFPKLRPTAKRDYPIGADNETMRNCRKAHLLVHVDLPPMGKNVSAVQRAEKKIKDYGELKAWCVAANSTRAKEWFFPAPEELAQATYDNGTLQSNYDMVAIVTNNYRWAFGVGFLQRIYEASFGMLIFCGNIPEKLTEADERVFPHTKYPFNYIHLSDQEVKWGFWMYYCMAKVAEMRLQNVKGYAMFSDDFIYNPWHPFDRSVANMGFRAPGYGPWWPNAQFGIVAANRTIALIKDKYYDRPDVVKFMAQYRAVLPSLNVSIGGRAITDPLEHMNIPDGWIVSDWVYLPATNLTFVQTFAQLMFEGGLFHELFFGKTMYLIPHKLYDAYVPNGVMSIWGSDRHKWAEKYTPHYVGLHPIKMSQFEAPANKKTYCDSVLTHFHMHLFGETSDGNGTIVG